MPIRDNGRGAEAFYPATEGPNRRTGRRFKTPIEPVLAGTENAAGLAQMLNELNQWLFKLYGMDRIGRKGIQVVLDWMSEAAQRAGGDMPEIYCPAPRQGRWPKLTIKPNSDHDSDLAILAEQACAVTQRWYAADHGTAADHQLFVNAMTLAFRLTR